MLGAAFDFATFNILTKRLTATESTFGIVFWMNAMQLPMGLAGSNLAVIGWLFFGEALDLFVFAGAFRMIVGILWNLRSETRRFTRLQLEETP